MFELLPSLSDLSNFRFVRPGMLLALLLLPLAYWVLRRAHAQRGAWARLIEPALQPFVLTTQLEKRGKRFSWIAYLIAALLIVALAGPTWEQLPQPVFTQQRPVVIALDLSQSMNAQDLVPSRLQVAKIKLRDLLRTRRDGQTALIAFAGDAFLVTPLTDDTRTIVSMLPSLSPRIMPVQGSRLAPPLELADALLTQAGAEPGEVILITDGVSDEADSQDAADRLLGNGHRVSVISVGTAQGGLIKDARGEFLRDRRGNMVMAPVETNALRSIARSGGGALYESNLSDAQIEQILLRDISEFSEASATDQEFTTDLWREQGPLLVLLCLPIVAFAFRRGVLLCLLVLVVFPEPYVHANLWDDAWQRRDQQGEKAFKQEEYDRAAALFKETQWQAAALYRAGKYAESAAALEGIDTAEANYNRGNALAKAQEIGEAIKAYERTLSMDAQHEDARFNRDLLKQMQQEQQSDEQQNQEQEQQDQEQQDQEQQESDQQGDTESEQSDDGEQSEDAQSEEGEESEQEDSQEQDGQSEEEREAERKEMQAQLAEQMTEEEKQQAVEQWLRRIPDDPGGLLRRKFKRQYRERGPAPRRQGEEW